MGVKRNFEITPDTHLWNAFRKGSEPAFCEIYTNYVQVLFNYGIRFSSDRELVKDCIQDIFIHIYNKKENLGDTNDIKLYLFKSLKRELIRTLQKKQKKISWDDADLPFLASYSAEIDIAANERQAEQNKILQQALNTLPDRQKEVLFLRFVEEMEYEQIQELMGINYQSVRNLMARSIQNLRGKLKEITTVQLYLIIISRFLGI